MKHEFGGPWTRKKLDILNDYLGFYTVAMNRDWFTLHYADAFAGTGIQNQKLIEGQHCLIDQADFHGSVLTALGVNPPFHRYHFNDLDPERATALEEIAKEHPDKQILITKKDANIFVADFTSTLNRNDRAVLFVDPYNTELDWATLEIIAKSGKIDLWLLFPISALMRMTPKIGANIIPAWKKTINRLLGTPDWEQALYQPKGVPVVADLFSHQEDDPVMERLNPDELQRWVKGRLEEIFSFVAEPVALKNNNSPLFSFFFAVSNTSPKAKQLASKVVNDILKKYP